MARTASLPAARNPLNNARQILTPVAGVVPPPDPSLGHVCDITLAANSTLAVPVYGSADAGPYAGERITFIIRQSGAGSFTLTYGAGYKAVGMALTASATAVDVHEFVFDGTTWNGCGKLLGATA